MPWDIENDKALNPTTRFFFETPEEEESEYVDLRIASDQENKEIFKKAGVKFEKKLVYNKQDRQMQYLRDLDVSDEKQDKFNEEVWDFSIVDWNLITPNGDKIPCTRENKTKLMRKSPKFASFVGDCLEELRNSVKGKKESELKN